MGFKIIKFGIVTIVFAAVVAITGFISYNFIIEVTTPLYPQAPHIVVEIKKGSNSQNISLYLQQKGLIRYPWAFKLLTRIKGFGNRLKAGEYRLSASMSPAEILDKIAGGKVIQHPVTIPEGYNVYEIGKLLEIHNIAKKESFVSMAFDPGVIDSFGFNTKSLEGYLFPDTYYFEKNVSEYDILEKFVNTFRKKVMTPEIMSEVEKSNLSFHKIITLASLIEKETGMGEERTLISAVFYNRLKKRMRLQCDPTVIYAIKNFDGNLRKKDLDIDSPYNTYRYRGLPPGPIANPGVASIKSALHPKDVNYLYFVAKKNGEHKFSNTLKEHNKAVLKYQLRRKGRK